MVWYRSFPTTPKSARDHETSEASQNPNTFLTNPISPKQEHTTVELPSSIKLGSKRTRNTKSCKTHSPPAMRSATAPVVPRIAPTIVCFRAADNRRNCRSLASTGSRKKLRLTKTVPRIAGPTTIVTGKAPTAPPPIRLPPKGHLPFSHRKDTCRRL